MLTYKPRNQNRGFFNTRLIYSEGYGEGDRKGESSNIGYTYDISVNTAVYHSSGGKINEIPN